MYQLFILTTTYGLAGDRMVALIVAKDEPSARACAAEVDAARASAWRSEQVSSCRGVAAVVNQTLYQKATLIAVITAQQLALY